MSEYFIVCKERSTHDFVVWWKPGGRGYTSNLYEAGRYLKHQARQIYLESRADDFPVPAAAIGMDLPTSYDPVDVQLVVGLERNREALQKLEKAAADEFSEGKTNGR